MKTFIVAILVLTVLSVVGGYILFYALDFGDIQMSIHGYLAMGLGIALSMLLGGGLMALVFYSNAKGHDDTTFTGKNDG